MDKKVTVIGGLNMDIKAKSKKPLLAGDSNPSVIEVSAGGVGRNIAHNLALLNIQTTLLTAVGCDDEGAAVMRQTAAAGVNMDKVLVSDLCRTGKYIAILDHDGEMSMAVSDMDVLDQLTPDYFKSHLETIKDSDFILCDANISRECLEYILDIAVSSGIPVCVDPVSAAKAGKLHGLMDRIHIITPNEKELLVLSGMECDIEKASNTLIAQGVSNMIATLGPNGLCHTDKNKCTHYASIAHDIADVTGAGDSLTAGLIYGLLKYQDFEKACRCGLAAAALTLSSKETVSASMNEETIQKLLNQ